jgi:hypothetical protein
MFRTSEFVPTTMSFQPESMTPSIFVFHFEVFKNICYPVKEVSIQDIKKKFRKLIQKTT